MIYGAMLAGGSGTRVKSSKIPKQFIEIGGKPIIIYITENHYPLSLILLDTSLTDSIFPLISTLSEQKFDIVSPLPHISISKEPVSTLAIISLHSTICLQFSITAALSSVMLKFCLNLTFISP